jgi:predicted nuclease of predicted toxin-antitoxin system
MNLYLDDNMSKPLLGVLLRRAGHQVTLPADVGTVGISDARHFVHALDNALVVLTQDHRDFEDLHLVVRAAQGQHPGILAVRMENDSKRDMKDRDIIRAIGNLERAGVPIANEFHVLNRWR